ncbi:reverse transcriptase domain-containing protein [Shouchella tritolerans]|uniref:reverse transcriptase domain-containing protein n=1 Tax=Shouchella tritolerans TaxID=2979466 RepID=UPI0021E815A9|nr:reverse transcriptase domain-containing protein [Shouchella tritolerans]
MLKEDLIDALQTVAERKAAQYQNYHNFLELEFQRNLRRVTEVSPKNVKKPVHWDKDNMHNPFYVLKHCNKIGSSIFKKLINNNYNPHEPYVRDIDKKGSMKKRPVYIFQIPDEAVSNYFYTRLLDKNSHRFSSFSYAYRKDRNVHYAIKDIGLDIKASSRTYIAEFDFKDFFGSINHDYLLKQFNENGFLISNFEKEVIYAFLNKMENNKGLPQGTSLSLFLANLACWKLDKKLEKEGLRFARYADDTIIWSDNYNKISKSIDFINEFSREAGVEINMLKSEGISTLSKEEMKSEFKKKTYIEFLGYKLSSDNISIKPSSVNKIKAQISYILYKNLIQPLNGSQLKSINIPSNDEDFDFVTAIMQIRRYLYGNLNESMLKNYLNGSYKRLQFKGIMSFYPLLDDVEQLKQLDKWLLSTILNTLKKRNILLDKWNYNRSNQFPFNVDGTQLLIECKKRRIKGKKGLMEIPSFLRIYNAIKENVITVGIEGTMHPKSNDY